jgi:hypothetical protein
METLDRSQIDSWLLSGEPVVRLWGRDYSISTERYAEWLVEVARAYQIDVQIKAMSEPPGVIVRAYLGKQPSKLVDPLLVVNKTTMPWLYCSGPDCENRIKDGYPPYSVCALHERG